MSFSSTCSDDQSPSSVSSGSCSAFNGSNDSSACLPGNLHNVKLLQSKIDVLNATLAHEKFRFAQEYKDMQSHYRFRIAELDKKIQLSKAQPEVTQVQRQDAHEEIEKLRSTISDLHQLLADHMARSSSENEELRIINANLQHQLTEQEAGLNLKETATVLEQRALIAEEKVKELEQRAEAAEEKSVKTEKLEMECRRLQSIVKKLEKKLVDQQTEVPQQSISDMTIQLADYRNKNEEMRLSFKASSKQASETIYKLRHQLSQKTKEKNEQLVKESQKPAELHKKDSSGGFSKSASRTISALREELSKKSIEHNVLSSLYAELEETQQKEMANFKRLETIRADKEVEEHKKKISQMLEKSDNRPYTSENNSFIDLNADYTSLCRKSLENMVKTFKQRLAVTEKENLFLKVEDANKQNSLYLLKRRLITKIEEQMKERREFQAKITAVNVLAKSFIRQNADCRNADERPNVQSPTSESKRKSSCSCDNKIGAKQVKVSERRETPADTKVSAGNSGGVTKIEAEEDCMIIDVNIKPEKAMHKSRLYNK